MRINFNSYDLSRGGGNRFIFELANNLVDRGHKVTITHLKSANDYMWFGTVKAEVTNYDFPTTLAKAFRKFYLKKHNIAYNEEYFFQNHIPDCDVNVAGWCMTTFPIWYSQKGKMFYLVQHYEPWFYPEDKAFVAKATLSYQLPMTKLCVSRWLTEKVGGVFIGNGINLDKFKPLNFDRRYDVMVLPRKNALKGNYEPLVSALRKNGLRVLVAENMSEFELVQAYNLSKIFLYLSESEGFGYPPLEALACGSAVVSTHCTEYLSDNQNGLLLPTNFSPETILWKIKWLLENKGIRESLIEQGFKTAQELTFSKVVDRFEEAIK